MLDAHQARTAIAEGQSESPERRPAPTAVDHPAADDQQDAPAQTDHGSQSDPAAAATAALLATALPMPIEVSTAPAASEQVPVATQMVVAGGPPTPVVQVIKPDAAELPVAAAVPSGAAPAAVAPVGVGDAAAAGTAVKADQAQAPAALPEAAGPTATSVPAQPGTDASGGQPQQQQQPDGKAGQTLQQARAAVAYARPAESQQAGAHAGQQAQAQSPVAPATSAVPPAAPAAPTSAATPVPLARAAEAVEHVLTLASSRGVTHARIALNPADLGAVDVHIRSTAEGLVARVVAHSAEAVQTLQHAAGDLRRSLEEQGLNLMSLDIGQPGESGTGRAGSDRGALAGGGHDGSPHQGAEPDDASTQTTTLRLPSGVLVDVLA
jgi:flagellar hook-length control protein FliK